MGRGRLLGAGFATRVGHRAQLPDQQQHGVINWANVAATAMANASEGPLHKVYTAKGLNNLVLAADQHISILLTGSTVGSKLAAVD